MWTRCHYLSDLQTMVTCLVEEYMYWCFFFFRTLLQTFSFWAIYFVTHSVTGTKRPQKSFSLHSFLWRPQKVESQNDQKKCFRQGKFQGRERKRERKWVSQPACLSRLLQIIYLGWKKRTFLKNPEFYSWNTLFKDDACYFFYMKNVLLFWKNNMQRKPWVDLTKMWTLLFWKHCLFIWTFWEA